MNMDACDKIFRLARLSVLATLNIIWDDCFNTCFNIIYTVLLSSLNQLWMNIQWMIKKLCRRFALYWSTKSVLLFTRSSTSFVAKKQKSRNNSCWFVLFVLFVCKRILKRFVVDSKILNISKSTATKRWVVQDLTVADLDQYNNNLYKM